MRGFPFRFERPPAAWPTSRKDSSLSTHTPVAADAAGFAALGVPQALVRALAAAGIDTPFPIQAATLPDSLAGRDVLGRGRTGSGKTLAFALPVVTALADSTTRRRPNRPRALVLVPTRELAAQVADTVAPLARAVGLRVATVYGGTSQARQVEALRRGVDVLVACPGRLEDLIQQRLCALDGVEVTVIDEADHMADLGFLPAVRRLLDATPGEGQRLLFSATLDNGVDVLVTRYLDNPVVHAVDRDDEAPSSVHHVLAVTSADKPAVVRTLAQGGRRTLLFLRTKHGARRLAEQLSKSGTPAVELHGDLSQGARARNLAAFAAGRVNVLVATDVAARGIHVDDVALVVHVDPPAEHKAFLHRSGRTGRAGASGTVVTLVTPDQRRGVAAIARAAGIRPVNTSVAPDHPLLAELIADAGGEVRPVVRPAPLDELPAHQPAVRNPAPREWRSARPPRGSRRQPPAHARRRARVNRPNS